MNTSSVSTAKWTTAHRIAGALKSRATYWAFACSTVWPVNGFFNSAVAMLDYVFRALLGAEMTSRQSTLFNFTIQLLIHIPGATLDTLIDLMQSGGLEQYREHLPKVDEDTRRFIDLKFKGNHELQ